MQTDSLTRFLNALTPASREGVRQLPSETQQKMAAAWEKYLTDDTDLLSLDELDPHTAEHQAAEHVVKEFG
ncbi:hypothetical protein ACIGXM_21695 [Kitasatospora sp. NPDC052896]|uniref:hypothetical protein n=1 Tax=Kitasatospora sp. NPDC052896 TaxID=3364061 RepID=UPI0037C6BB14